MGGVYQSTTVFAPCGCKMPARYNIILTNNTCWYKLIANKIVPIVQRLCRIVFICNGNILSSVYTRATKVACYSLAFCHNTISLSLEKNKTRIFSKKHRRFDKTYRRLQNENPGVRIEVYLHKSCKPLDEVDFTDKHAGQLDFDFKSECEGMCGL